MPNSIGAGRREIFAIAASFGLNTTVMSNRGPRSQISKVPK
jgi:hypothetical protein